MINRKLVLAARPKCLVKDSDLRLETEEIRSLKVGEILVQTVFLSLAPVMKYYMIDGAGFENPLNFGDTMRGRGVGRIIQSRNPLFSEGDIVQGKFGWQEYVISTASAYDMMYKVDTRGLSPSLALGVLGVTGFTSYFGLYEVGRLKEGDQVLISSAAGGVGSSLGYLSKIKNATVVGLTSSDEKARILVEQLGYDAAINYKSENLDETIKHYLPEGIDIFFDNVGGEILDTALGHINKYARVVECGRISTYKDDLKVQDYALRNWHKIGAQRARMEGFFIYDYEPRFSEAAEAMSDWIKEGKLGYLEDIQDGLESMPTALNRLFQGENMGKQLVRISRY